ncbi:Rap-GAP domain-containing protein [Entamoeba marina]
MLSTTILNTQLLQQPLNTDLLKFLEIDVQQLVIKAITTNLITHQTKIIYNLHTDEHVNWVMEVIGAGFSLPLTDIDTISDCLTIYDNWFNDESLTPYPVADRKEEYARIAIGQISLLFVRRHDQNTSLNILAKYADLCDKALVFLMKATECIDSSILHNNETLKRIVCVLLAAVDDLCGPMDCLCNSLPMSRVVEHAIGCFYQLWAVWSPTEKEIWNVVLEMHKKWIQVYEVASTWSFMVNTLQNSLMKCIFIEKGDSFTVEIQNTTISISQTFGKEYGFYYFIKMLHMCGNPINILDGKVSAVVQQGFNDLVNNMIEICNNPSTPDGNDLFNIYIDPLFHMIKYQNHDKFVDAVCVSIKSLVSIYINLSEKTYFKNEYTIKVIKAIECGLLSSSLKVTECTIQVIHGLFNEKTFEMTLLLPSLLFAVTNCSNHSNTTARLSTLQLINEFITISCKGRSSNTIPTLRKDSLVSYENVWNQMLNHTLQVFQVERNPENLKELIKIMSKLILDGINCEDIDKTFINISSNFVMYEHQLTTLLEQYHSELVDFLKILLNSSSKCTDPYEVILPIFNFLLDFIEKNMDNKEIHNVHILVGTFSEYFIKCFDHLSLERLLVCCDVMNYVFSQLETKKTEESKIFFDLKLINAMKKYGIPINDLLTPIDEICLMNIFNQYPNYKYESYVHLFESQNSILTFVELPWLQTDDLKSVIIIIRNSYGKQCYQLTLQNKEIEWVICDTQNDFASYEKNQTESYQVKWDTKSEFDITNVINKLDKTLSEKKESSPTLKKPTNINYQTLTKQQTFSPSIVCRMLVNFLNYTEIDNVIKVLPNTLEVLKSLQLLDSISTKHHISVDINNKTKPTKEFVMFINELGRVIQYNNGNQVLEYDDDPFYYLEFKTDTLQSTKTDTKSLIQIHWDQPLKESDNFQISIIPTISDLFVVSTNYPVSTLEKTQLIHISTLPFIIKESIISYYRRTFELLTPLKNRENAIKEIVSNSVKCLPFIDVLFSSDVITGLNESGFKHFESFCKSNPVTNASLISTTYNLVDSHDSSRSSISGSIQNKPTSKIIRTTQIPSQTKPIHNNSENDISSSQPLKQSKEGLDNTNLQSPNAEKKKKLNFFRRSTSKK